MHCVSSLLLVFVELRCCVVLHRSIIIYRYNNNQKKREILETISKQDQKFKIRNKKAIILDDLLKKNGRVNHVAALYFS